MLIITRRCACLSVVWAGTNATRSTIDCPHACFIELLAGATPAPAYTVRDLWLHTDIATTSCSTNPGHCDGFSASVPGGGGSRIFKVTVTAADKL